MAGSATIHRSDKRNSYRTNMYVAAVLRGSGISAAVKVRNMSAVGALVEAPSVPAVGASVHLLRGSLCVPAEVVWAVAGKCGLRFSSVVSVADWLVAPSNAQQQIVDQAVSIVKAGAVPLAAARTWASVRAAGSCLTDELAGDLDAGCRLLEALGDILANDPDVVARHASKLQNVDIVAQTLAAVASALKSMDVHDTAGSARLRDLRTSCAQALGSAR